MQVDTESNQAPEGDFQSASVEFIKATQRKHLIQWALRSAITGTLLWWLGSMFAWVKIVFYIWAFIAVLSLAALLFLPRLLVRGVGAMGGGAGFDDGDFGGVGGGSGSVGGFPVMPDEPRDVDVEDVDDAEPTAPREPLQLPGFGDRGDLGGAVDFSGAEDAAGDD